MAKTVGLLIHRNRQDDFHAGYIFGHAQTRNIKHFLRTNKEKARYHLYYIVMRQTDKRLLRSFTVRHSSVDLPESDYNLVVAAIHLLGRFTLIRR